MGKTGDIDPPSPRSFPEPHYQGRDGGFGIANKHAGVLAEEECVFKAAKTGALPGSLRNGKGWSHRIIGSDGKTMNRQHQHLVLKRKREPRMNADENESNPSSFASIHPWFQFS
jgi:hypothetical protein